jgi:hypothetical protein
LNLKNFRILAYIYDIILEFEKLQDIGLNIWYYPWIWKTSHLSHYPEVFQIQAQAEFFYDAYYDNVGMVWSCPKYVCHLHIWVNRQVSIVPFIPPQTLFAGGIIKYA